MTEIEKNHLTDLERRVRYLEKKMADLLWQDATSPRARDIVSQYGESMTKSDAARVLGVTRATIYHMLDDGRLKYVGFGKRVSSRSVAGLIEEAEK